MNNLNISHLRRNQDLNYYQPYNNRESNQYGNRNINNKPAGKKKKEGELKEEISNKSPLVIISDALFKYSATVQPIPMSLDIDNGLPAIHMIFGTSNMNAETFFTHVNSCPGMNLGNIRLHKLIITTNPDIVDSYIQFG